LHFNKIILPIEDVGTEEWEQELLKAACPDNLNVLFANIPSIRDFYPDIVNDDSKTIILLGSMKSCYDLVKLNFPHKRFNVGGLHYKADREELLPYVFLSEEEKQMAREIMGKGYQLIAQDLPENREYDLRDLLK
jgi:mannose/fructose/N-acetylgalactosamine-specific phosphotransferase system component IIB